MAQDGAIVEDQDMNTTEDPLQAIQNRVQQHLTVFKENLESTYKVDREALELGP
jgi:hypothetical protein